MPTTPVLDRITDAQAVVLDRLDQARTPAVHLVERAVGVADRVVPVGTTTRTRVVPRVGDALDRQFAFALELLKRQRSATKAMVRAAARTPKAAGKGNAKADTAGS
jgi:hypothetical protein